MQTEEDLEKGYETVLNYIERLGDDIVHEDEGEASDEEENEYKWRLVVAEENFHNCFYHVMGRSNYEGFILRYSYDLIASLQGYIETPEGKEEFELEEETDKNTKEIVKGIIDRVDEDDMDRLEYQLYDKISDPEVAVETTHTDKSNLAGFNIYTLCFVNEDSNSLSDFHDKVTAVTTIGEKGSKFLSNAFAIQMPEDKNEYVADIDPSVF